MHIVPDFRSVFQAVPGAYLVLAPDLTIAALALAARAGRHTVVSDAASVPFER
jgi:hypothetical protein